MPRSDIGLLNSPWCGRVQSRGTHPRGQVSVGVDRDYTEAYTDSDEERHGQGLGDRLPVESDSLKVKE